MESGRDIQALPEGCILNVVALTSPADACRLCTVCSVFRSAAESDSVWERFLPLDYQSIISRSDATSLSSWSSKKQLYFSLCHNPILIDHGRKSFSLDKASGKKCFMLSAEDLVIVWGADSRYWRWIYNPDSRFAQVAKLIDVCWLEISAKINTSMLSAETLYAAYLVFKIKTDSYGLENLPVKVSARLVGADNVIHRSVRTETIDLHLVGPRVITRGDGWQEIELGEFYSKGGEELEMSFEGHSSDWKRGLVVEGIEVRPKLSAGLT